MNAEENGCFNDVKIINSADLLKNPLINPSPSDIRSPKFKNSKTKKVIKSFKASALKQEKFKALKLNEKITNWNCDAPPQLLPPRKFCDVTGLEAHYTHPATSLRYHNKDVYYFIQNYLSKNEVIVNEYLNLRKNKN
ncbi:chromatin-remodeling complex subunit ies6 [Clydaea vesicula]|uniref:Chromatin-remodeling complex subunit ies6 n=1 Tax=Clydaea vesicula TaxID=447962 RepID=A0AAD5Y0B0_9FUNG|nr:chromatin-remodeling complex subunit ies6 [Clydaea vesicula]